MWRVFQARTYGAQQRDKGSSTRQIAPSQVVLLCLGIPEDLLCCCYHLSRCSCAVVGHFLIYACITERRQRVNYNTSQERPTVQIRNRGLMAVEMR